MGHRKAVFLDVDGTLVDEGGRVPQSAQQAVRDARVNGHLVFLCTGRSVAELWPEILDIGFDGLVAAAGAYVRVRDEVLIDQAFPERDVRHIHDYLTSQDITFYLQGHDRIYATRRVQERLRQLIGTADGSARLESGLFRFIEGIEVDADPLRVPITKAIYLDSPVPLDAVRTELGGACDVIPCSVALFPDSGEVMLPGVHKATGIDALTRHLGIDQADTIAIGDSHNDLEMLAHVALGVAMGNAPLVVQQAADELTTRPEEDGIQRTFVRHGLVAS